MRRTNRRARSAAARVGVRRRRLTTARAATLLAVPLALLGGATAQAADSCPNAELRIGASAHLPECRAYELVSPVDKHGNAVTSMLLTTADGKIAYSAIGAFADAQSAITGVYSARRTDAGWATTALNPPTLWGPPDLLSQVYAIDFDEDLSTTVLQTTYGVDRDDRALSIMGTTDLYRIEAGGHTEWMSRSMLPSTPSAYDVSFGGASDDLDHVVFQTQRRLVPEVPDESVRHVYVGDGETTQLVSVAPDGSPFPGGASIVNAPLFYSAIVIGGVPERSVSADAQTIVLSAGGQLYVRTDALDPSAAQTRQISRSADGLTECSGILRYLTMARDGSRVLFGCSDQLTPDSPGGATYVYDVATGGLSPLGPFAQGAEPLAADDDAEHLYLRSQNPLTPDTPGFGTNLYVLAGAELRYIGTLASATEPFDPTILSPDGSEMVFVGTGDIDPELDENGYQQVFRYDADTGEVSCASCPVDGSPAGGRAGFNGVGGPEYAQAGKQPTGGAVSADGRRVFFTSASRLVPEDVNSADDVYMLLDGRHHLISTGKERHGSIFAGASADGTDVFLATSASLAPQDVDEGVIDMYSARIGGGFALPPGKRSCDGDACQGPPTAPPAAGPLGSQLVTGEGNAPEEPPAAPVARVTVAGRKAVRGRAATLAVRTSGAGTITVSGASVRRVVRSASKGARYRVTVRLTAKARKRLARRGRVQATVKVSYRAKTGGTAARTVRLTFRGPKGGR